MNDPLESQRRRHEAMAELPTDPRCLAARESYSQWRRRGMARAGVLLTPVTRAPASTVVPTRARARARGAGRPRAAATRSSAKSGDSGDDPPPPPVSPAAAPWRWASEAAWRSFVASVESRDVERELYLERMHEWSR